MQLSKVRCSGAEQIASLFEPFSCSYVRLDEMLQQFKRAAAVGHDVTEIVAEALNQSKNFLTSLQDLRAQVLRDWELDAHTSRSAFGEFISNAQTAVHSLVESFRHGAENVSEHMEKLKQGSKWGETGILCAVAYEGLGN